MDRIGARPPGSPANRRACEHAAGVLRAAGLEVREDPFTTRWWEPGTARLEVRTSGPALRAAERSRHGPTGGGDRSPDAPVDGPLAGIDEVLTPNPYSPAGTVEGCTEVVVDTHALARLRPDPGRILILTDTLTEVQLLPACFPFLEDPAHDEIRRHLHRLAPAAVVAVSDHWEPVLEDPDLPFPSVTIPSAAGPALRDGVLLRLEVTGAVHAGHGVNVSARTQAGRRLVLCAHLDTKATTPGAFDNAGSVAVLLALAETGGLDDLPVEVVLFNGEDHVDACGEMAWLTRTDLDEIVGVVNLDGIGLRGLGTSLGTSLASLACPPQLAEHLDGWVDADATWVQTEPWYEGDHAVFALQGIPAVAITSEDVHALLGGLAHTASDTREQVDLEVLTGVARRLPDLLRAMAQQLS